MHRRSFLAGLGVSPLLAQPPRPPSSTVLFGDRVTPLTNSVTDESGLWVAKSDLKRINGFDLKPQGACLDELCIPVPKNYIRANRFHLTAFAKKLGQAEVRDRTNNVWSYGEIPVIRGRDFGQGIAPDFTLPDRKGNPVKLSQFRGKKVLLLTWASW